MELIDKHLLSPHYYMQNKTLSLCHVRHIVLQSIHARDVHNVQKYHLEMRWYRRSIKPTFPIIVDIQIMSFFDLTTCLRTLILHFLTLDFLIQIHNKLLE